MKNVIWGNNFYNSHLKRQNIDKKHRKKIENRIHWELIKKNTKEWCLHQRMTNREQTLKWNKNSYNYYYCSELHTESVARVGKDVLKQGTVVISKLTYVVWRKMKKGREQQAWKRADVKRSCWLPFYHAHDVIILADKMSVQTRVHNRMIFSNKYSKDEKLKLTLKILYEDETRRSWGVRMSKALIYRRDIFE